MNEKFFALPKEKQQAIIHAGYRVFSRNSYKIYFDLFFIKNGSHHFNTYISLLSLVPPPEKSLFALLNILLTVWKNVYVFLTKYPFDFIRQLKPIIC